MCRGLCIAARDPDIQHVYAGIEERLSATALERLDAIPAYIEKPDPKRATEPEWEE